MSQTKRPPNILFLFPDQLRWDWIGCEKQVPVRTPNIDRLAERGVRFTQCRVNSPVCSPSRACLATGLRYHDSGVPNLRVNTNPDDGTVFQALRDQAGYRVATTGKNDLRKPELFRGLQGWRSVLGRLGFTEAVDQSGKLDASRNGWPEPQDAYTAHLHAHGLMKIHHEDYARRRAERSYATAAWPSPLPRRHYTDDFTGQATLRLLDGLPIDEPWMMWVNFPGPHDPFDPPEELKRRYDGVDFPPPVAGNATATNPAGETYEIEHQQLRRNYAAMTEGIDEWVGWIIDAVEQRGELDNTIIVFSSDHGEMLGDHGRWNKSTAHEGSVHVPLIIAGPGVREGGVSEALVELIDVTATLCDLADVQMPGERAGRSLVPLLRNDPADDASHRDVQTSQLEKWRLVCDGRNKLVEWEDGSRELWDVNDETRDLADEDPTTLDRLADAMQRELGPFTHAQAREERRSGLR